MGLLHCESFFLLIYILISKYLPLNLLHVQKGFYEEFTDLKEHWDLSKHFIMYVYCIIFTSRKQTVKSTIYLSCWLWYFCMSVYLLPALKTNNCTIPSHGMAKHKYTRLQIQSHCRSTSMVKRTSITTTCILLLLCILIQSESLPNFCFMLCFKSYFFVYIFLYLHYIIRKFSFSMSYHMKTALVINNSI